MWSSTQQGGGFMDNTMSSPSASGGTGGDKGKKKQNIVPVQITEILEAPEENFTVEGSEVGMAVVAGRVTSMEKAATKSTYRIQDESGEIEVIHWVEEGSVQQEFCEGSLVKVTGSVRFQQDKRHVMAFKISPIADQVEYDSHLLQVVYSHLKMRQLNQKINGQIGLDGGLSNSMMGTGLGGGMSSVPAAAGQGQSFGNKGYDMVYNVIKGGMDDAGVNRDAIFQQVKSSVSRVEMDKALDYLSSEGHVYSTIDEDHFKTTDGD